MNTRLKHWLFAALLLSPVLFSACSGNKTARAKDDIDSNYIKKRILQINFRKIDENLAFIDTLEMMKWRPPYYLNYMRFMEYNNNEQYRKAIHYGTLAMSEPLFKKEMPMAYLQTMVFTAYNEYIIENYAKSIKMLKNALEIAKEERNEEMQAHCYNTMGHVLMALHDYKEGVRNLTKAREIAVKLLKEEANFRNYELTFKCIYSLFNELIPANMPMEAEKYVPEFLALLEKAKMVDELEEDYIDDCKWFVYIELMKFYDKIGKTEESEKYRILSQTTQTSKRPTSLSSYISYYLSQKRYKEALTDIDIIQKDFSENKDTISQYYLDVVLKNKYRIHKAIGNKDMALSTADKIIECRDSIDKKTKEENAAELAKIYETQEKEKQIAEQKAELAKHKNILIAVVVLLVIGVAFIVIVMRFNRRVNRRNKTIVATINQMMQKEDKLTRMQLTDDSNADNVNPEEIRLKQSLEMLKEDKPTDEIVTQCGYRDAADFNKKFYGHFGIHADEYRKWSKKINEQEKAGDDEAKQMKDSFIKNMSHEIRTPLNQIFGFVQLLTDPNYQLSDDEKRQYNKIIGEQTTYMTRMLNKFLEISEYESRKEPLTQETVAIDDLFNEVNSVVPRPTDGVELTFSNNSGRTAVEANHEGLSRIIQCLVGNAVKFTSSGSISVECSTNAEGKTIFTVTDTGKGIPEGDEERIFDRFYKVDEFVPGAGLGLSLVREIARCMEATVVLDRSYAAKGSRFVVTLRA